MRLRSGIDWMHEASSHWQTSCIAGPLCGESKCFLWFRSENFLHYWPIMWGIGIHMFSVVSQFKGPVMQSFDGSIIVSMYKLLNKQFPRVNVTALWHDPQLLVEVIMGERTQHTGIILCMCPANERRHYNVTSSLIGCVHSQNDSWAYITI